MSNNDNLKRLNIILRTISKINQQLIIFNDEKKLCQKICCYLVRIKGYKFVWMGLKESENDKLTPIALAGKNKNFIKYIKNSWNKYGFNGCPTSMALKSGKYFVIEDLKNVERFVPWDKKAIEEGFLSAVVLPIKYHNDVIGTLHVYSDMKKYFLEEEVSFLNEVARDISIGIKSIRDGRELIESKREYEELFKRISSCVAIYKAKDNGNDFIFKDFNQAAEKAEKIKREDIIGKSVLKVFPGVKDFGLFDVFKRVYKTGKPENHDISIYKDKRISGWRENFIYKLPCGDVVAVYNDLTEKKQAEEELIRANERLALAQKSAGAGVWDWDMNTGKLNWSPEFYILFGLDPKKYTSTFDTWRRVIHPDDRQGAEEKINESIKEQKPLFNEYRIVLPSGEIRWINALGNTIYDEHGKAVRMSGICIDTTERKQAEDLLRIERERLANILEGTNVGTWEWNVQTGETVFNEHWANIIGYTLDEISPVSIETWERFSHPGDLEKSNEQLSKVFAKEIDYYDIECRMKHKDGNWVWVQDRGKVTSWTPDGKPLWMSGTHTDITERKRMEESMRTSEEKFAKAFYSSPQGLSITALDNGELIEVNNSLMNILGYSREEIIGHTTLELGVWVNQEDRTRFVNILKKEGSVRNKEFEFRAKAGGIGTLLVSAELIDVAGKACMLSTLYNITERKKAEEDLKISYKKTKKILEEIIKTLSVIVEIRDPYTSGHQQKVAQIATSIATEMGLEQDRINGISTAAIIHDIGKIIIPASILSKPGKISEIEYNMIKTHSETGYNMLKNIDFPWPVAKIVLQHHERINGTGYPKGLKGKNILLEAKILAVADVLEAMTSHRPYRPSLGLDIAIKELEENKGILYDSEIVDICNKLIKSGVIDFHRDQQN